MGPTKSFTISGASSRCRLVKFGGSDGVVAQADAATAKIVGALAPDVDPADGDRVDVTLGGFCKIQLGGAVTRGDLLTSDANGKAVAAAPGAGVNNSVIGRAQVSGVDGDIVDHFLTLGSLQG